jgi:hypothetical protein
MLKQEIQLNVYSITSRMIIPLFILFFIPSFVQFCVLANTPRFMFTNKIFHPCFFHFEGYVVRIIIVTS